MTMTKSNVLKNSVKKDINEMNIAEHIKPYINSDDTGELKINVPERFNLGAAITDWVIGAGESSAEKTAFLVENEDGSQNSLSYLQLHQASNQFGQLLKASGIQTGSRMVIKLPNCLAYPVAFLGAVKAGYIATPISKMLTATESAFIVRDSGASVLVTIEEEWQSMKAELAGIFQLVIIVDGTGEAFSDGSTRIVNWGDVAKQPGDIVAEDTSANDPAYLVYTSGTTGNPKGVLHAHRSVLGRLPAAFAWFDFSKPQRIMHTGKLNWTYVLGTAMMDPLFHGQTVIAYEGENDASKWMELVAKHSCTTFIAVPTIYRQILHKTGANREQVPSLQHCMCAGEKLSEQVLSDFQERFGLVIHEGLGMSEVSYYISQPPGVPLKEGATGMIQPGHLVSLLDKNMQEVAPGDEGMIAISLQDPGLFLKYWNRPEEQNEVIQGDWFLTGDYAILDEENYLFFLGRRDDIINTFGFRVSPFEIEKVLKDHPAIANGVVVAEELSLEKVILSAAIVLHPGKELGEDELKEFLSARLARYKVPKKFTFLDRLPRTQNGKVLRKELKKQLSGQ